MLLENLYLRDFKGSFILESPEIHFPISLFPAGFWIRASAVSGSLPALSLSLPRQSLSQEQFLSQDLEKELSICAIELYRTGEGEESKWGEGLFSS